jgi:hypothetical protein
MNPADLNNKIDPNLLPETNLIASLHRDHTLRHIDVACPEAFHIPVARQEAARF